MRVLEAFAGLGGQALGWHRAGAEHVAFVERDPLCRRVLARHWAGVPLHEDVTTVDAAPWRGRVDVLTGGPPCQPVSTAGRRGGTADERWLWGAFVSLAVAIEAPVVVAENPPGLLSAQGGDAMYAVLCTFGDAGYSVEWDCLAAGTVGAPHRRERVFLVARRDGRWTWSASGAQPQMFPGRPAAWPWSGRWERHTLTTCERRWPTPSTLPWEVAAEVEALPTPTAQMDGGSRSGPNSAAHPGLSLPDVVLGTGGGLRRALPTPQAHDAQGQPGAEGGREADLPTAVRRALPTPAGGDHRAGPTYARGNPTLVGEACRRALPTPAARDCRDPNSADSQERRNDGSARGQQLPNELRDRGLYPEGVPGRLSPALPEWMLGLPEDWSYPDGPSLLDARSRPYLPDLTAELALTTEREHRRPRLRALGNACQVEVAEVIARAVLASARQDGEQDRQDGAPASPDAD